MIATNELRWVEREKREPWPDPWNPRVNDAGQLVTEKVSSWPVLQQRWAGNELNSMTGQYMPMQEWRDVPTVKEQAQPAQRKPIFKEFIEWAKQQGYDCASTCNSDTGEWICLNPMTADLWKAWQAAHLIGEPG